MYAHLVGIYLVDFELGWDQSFADLPSKESLPRMIHHHQIELKIGHRAHDRPPMIFTVKIFREAMLAIRIF